MLRPMLALTLVLSGCSGSGGASGPPLVALSAAPATPTSFALLELVTSQGCSDTPPSEALTREIVASARATDQRIFALAYHVDYWDGLGWKDLFGSPSYTARQRRYAATTGDGMVYTPQTFVNGTSYVIGTDRAKLDGLLQGALAAPAAATVSLTFPAQPAGQVAVAWTATGAPAGAQVQLALVERDVSTKVERGENAGKTLAQAPLVRTLTAVDAAAGQGTATLAAPADMKWDRAGIVAFVQDPAKMAVLGATALDLAQAP